MRNLICFLLIITSLALSLGSYANAADAWLLWTKTTSLISGTATKEDWKLSQSFDDKKQCVEALHGEANDNASSWKNARLNGRPAAEVDVNLKDTSGHVTILVSGKKGDIGLLTSYDYLCLPDTIDPKNR